MEKIEIGKIVKEQGIKGDVKVIIFADDNFDFSCLGEVYINNIPAKIEKVYKLNGGLGIKFDIIDSRNTASTFKNALIYANKTDINCQEGRFFIADLLNKKVYTENNDLVGVIFDVQNFGSADVIYIKTNSKNLLVSHVKGLIMSVNAEKVVLNSQKLKEVGVYED